VGAFFFLPLSDCWVKKGRKGRNMGVREGRGKNKRSGVLPLLPGGGRPVGKKKALWGKEGGRKGTLTFIPDHCTKRWILGRREKKRSP